MTHSFPHHRAPAGRTKQGFALVVTLTLMILLTMVAVGLLSLSAISLRSSTQVQALAEARANARLALMLAIGELQKELGPDQRISARAGILDASPASDEVEGVANPHYLGVWDSWNTWLTDRKGSLSIQDTYKRGRDPMLFRSWLISHPAANAYQTALNSTGNADSILLCGKGSAGPDPGQHVSANRVRLPAVSRNSGGYAWWIADESQKARLNLDTREAAGSISNAQIVASHTGRMGIEKMAGMAGFDTSRAALEKMITTGQAGINSSGVSKHFHDLTAQSMGLLTDVRSGGFKSDLNLAFESDTVPAQMNEARLFGANSYDAPIRPMTGELAGITPQNPFVAPMSWRQMREYYRLYRSGFPESASLRPVYWSGGKPATRRLMMGKGRTDPNGKWEERDTKGYARDLVMLRQTWIVATKSELNPATPGGIDYYILAIPVITLWNPYNITLQVDATEMSYLGAMYWSAGMRQRVYRGNTLIADTSFPDTTTWPGNQRPNHDLTSNQFGYRMIPTQPGRNPVIEFKPGEVRVFSTDAEIRTQTSGSVSDGAMYNRFFYASPGYTPVQNTGPGVLRGLRYKVNSGSGASTEPLSFSLRLAEAETHNDNFYLGANKSAGLVWNFHEVLNAKHGAVYENGRIVDKQAAGEWQDVAYLGATSVDWLTSREIGGAWIVRDDPANRAQWGPPASPPIPVGIFSIVAKSAERFTYDNTSGYTADFRNRSWLHAPPTRLSNFLMNPTNLNRADSAYQVHFRPVNGDQEVSQYLQADGLNGYFGGSYTASEGQTHVTAHALPTSPIVNLGSFAGIRMDRGRARFPSTNTRYGNIKHMAHAGGAFGAGIGNGYAHPMIAPDKVYTRNNFGVDAGFDGQQATNVPICDDYWDHLFLANEELWDSWFCSGIAPVVNNGSVVTPKKSVAEDFFSNKPTHVSRHFQPYLRDKSPQALANLVETTSATGNGWERVASHMLNKGQFNVNSTSREAWKALLLSLTDRPLVHSGVSGVPLVMPADPERVSLSRHPLANSDRNADGPRDENAWRGIRKLTTSQIDQLADEIVRQVKLRGPFLNMAEFINRRLSNDELGVTGALQAAIDWDEFNAGYDGSTGGGTGESINKGYKGEGSMITDRQLPAPYPNRKAATGSRYAGIPGYVMQSDILQGISASLSVRGDTFLIRACGESLLPDGKIAARVWCEAVVQRLPEYIDPTDEADKQLRSATQAPGASLDLKPLNLRFGRRFNIISFRWLNPDEI
jgi:hypothetical protein